MSELIDRLEAEGSPLSLEAVTELKKQYRRASDAEYMKRAYVEMLGPKGLEVVEMWLDQGITRIHYSWGPEALQITGEARAELILSMEGMPKKERLNLD